MRIPLFAMTILFLAFTCNLEVKAQASDPKTGSVGSTTTSGNSHWVSAQVAIGQGAVDAAFLSADRACQEGTAIACAFAGELIIQGQASLATPEQSAGLFKRGCELGNANACQGIGLMLVQGIGIAEDAKAGRAFMERACQSENAMACANLGLMHKMGMFGPPNQVQAMEYLNQALLLMPENEIAKAALVELQAKAPQRAGGERTASATQGPILRGRAESDKQAATVMNESKSLQSQSELTLCQRAAFTGLVESYDPDPKKPSWNLTPNTGTDPSQTNSQVVLLLALSAKDPADFNPSMEGNTTISLPRLSDCEAKYSIQIKALEETNWRLAAAEPNQTIIYAASASKEGRSTTITMIIDSEEKSEARHKISSGLWSSRSISTYNIDCQSNEPRLLLALQFDARSRLFAASGLPFSTVVEPVATLAKHAEIARTLACAPPQQVPSPANTYRLQAALSLRFERDQQQTP